MDADFVWTAVAFILTLLTLSYLLGDNPLFRLAAYLFVGASAGYVAVILLFEVIVPRLVFPLIFGNPTEKLLAVVPAVLSALLLLKLFPRLTSLGNPSMAFLVGSGAAVIVGGAVSGTLFGQIRGAIQPFALSQSSSGLQAGGQLISGLILAIGTVSTLIYFQFSARRKANQQTSRSTAVQMAAFVGQIFIAITLGALYAGVLAAALTALIERFDFLRTTIQTFLP